MRIFGLPVPFTKAFSPVSENRGGWYRVFESWPGAWQHNVTIDRDLVLTYHAVYACMTLIASDIAKLRVKLVERVEGIWSEVAGDSPFLPVLRKPNPYQTRIQFWEYWLLSKLVRGNTYALKFRDARGIVTRLYILDPQRVIPMVADSGDVFYQLSTDNLSGLTSDVLVPAREIIHDRFNCLFHPLVGTSPIIANGLAATVGLKIETNSATLFGNRSMPGGILTAPGAIGPDTATRLKEHWDANYTGENFGKVAVLGDGLKFEPIAMTAQEGQLIEQLKWTAEVVCSTFHVPPYKIGVGTMPTYNNIQSLNVEYYSQCLQRLIEDIELCLDEGLGLDIAKEGRLLGTEFDLDGLLRMDSVTQMSVLKEASGIMTIDEKRRKLDLKKVEGGDSVYLQQQDYSLSALAKRDAQDDPFGTAKPAALPAPDISVAEEPDEDDAEVRALAAGAMLRKALGAPLVLH